MTNHVANEKMSVNVVIPHVRHASELPVSRQNCSFSGSHFVIFAIQIFSLIQIVQISQISEGKF